MTVYIPPLQYAVTTLPGRWLLKQLKPPIEKKVSAFSQAHSLTPPFFPQSADSYSLVGIKICLAVTPINSTEERQSQMVHHCQGLSGTAPAQSASLGIDCYHSSRESLC